VDMGASTPLNFGAFLVAEAFGALKFSGCKARIYPPWVISGTDGICGLLATG
jgi:hypothetical protein